MSTLVSHPIIRAPNPKLAIGQFGGHVKMGVETPRGQRTKNRMALVSALPLAPGSDKMVLSFLDRSDPRETFDAHPGKGDNAVIVVPAAQVHVSIINGVNPGDCKGVKVMLGPEIREPVDLDVDQTGLDVDASDAWVDLVDELGVDCSKYDGYPLWANAPLDIDRLTGRSMRFHHRITGDLVDFGIGDGAVIYVFVDEDGSGGAICWQQARY